MEIQQVNQLDLGQKYELRDQETLVEHYSRKQRPRLYLESLLPASIRAALNDSRFQGL